MDAITTYLPITDPTWIFFLVLCVILFAPMIFSKLRIPHLIGMILAGVLIGEHGFNLLARDASFELFGKVGIYYIMFLAGLEMDLQNLKQNRVKGFAFGFITTVIPFGFGFLAGYYFLDYSLLASLLLACILASHTLVAYPIVGRYGLSKSPSVTISIAATMVALLSSLLFLAGISGTIKGTGGFWFWALFVLKFALFIFGMFFLLPRLIRAFFRKFSDPIIQFTFTLAVVFLSAATAEFCGLEGIFGAFLAGLVLNRFVPNTSPLMNRIEFIGNAIFIPYFLIGVGMLINIGALFESWHTAYIVACMVVMGTVGKMLAGYAAGIGFRLPVSHGHMMFGLTSAHAAGSIAIILVGLRMEIAPGQYLVDSDMLNGVVMMILFTCVISSIITEKASRQIALEDLSTCEEKAADDEKMLLPLSFQGNLDTLVSTAILMRNERLNRGLIGLSVALDDDNVVRNQAAGKTLLERAEKAAGESDVRMQTQSRIATNIANGIMHAFKENNASEIVMGLHGQKTEGGGFWGNFLEDLFTELNRQIIMVTAKQPLSTIRRIQVAVPSRAEYEPGFHRWLDRLSRMSGNLDCRIQFHGKQNTLALISEYIRNTYPDIRADYTLMAHWNELPKLASQIHEDHLFVVVTARKSTVSYRTAFEKLPAELNQYFKQENLMIIFPDQYGEPMNVMSFAAPQKRGQMSAYTQIRDWMARQTQT